MRELSLAPQQIVHPDHLEDRSLWLDPEVRDLMDRLHNGDASLGWEGDPRLALYRGPGRRWELWRLEADGEYRMVMRSKPGLHLDNRLIMHIVAHDSRRGYDVAKDINDHNTALVAGIDAVASEKVQAAADKLYFGLRQDFGAKFDGTLGDHM